MSKSKKRTISSLMKTRTVGRFSHSGFDLLGDGERIRAAVEGSGIGNDLSFDDAPLPSRDDATVDSLSPAKNAGKKSASAKKAAADIAVVEIADAEIAVESGLVAGNASAGSAAAKNASAKSAKNVGSDAKSALAKIANADSVVAGGADKNIAGEKSTTAKKAAAKTASKKSAAAKNATAKIANAKNAIATKPEKVKRGPKLKNKSSSGEEEGRIRRSMAPTRPVVANRDAFHMAVQEIDRLKQERESSTLVENYIFDTLFARINNPSASVIYMYLWRRTAEKDTKSIALSMRVLSEAIGISKRTAHDAIKKLNEMGLIVSTKTSSTGFPEHQIKTPWKDEQ